MTTTGRGKGQFHDHANTEARVREIAPEGVAVSASNTTVMARCASVAQRDALAMALTGAGLRPQLHPRFDTTLVIVKQTNVRSVTLTARRPGDAFGYVRRFDGRD